MKGGAMVKITTLDEFTRGYIECAMWASTDNSRDDGGDPLDRNFTVLDVAPDALAEIITECADFQAANAEDIAGKLTQAGHDFFLTRNGHGAGFWDGDWPDTVGTRLTANAKACGSQDWYVTDDRRIAVQ